MLTSPIYRSLPRKVNVNARRINKELRRKKLALASFIPVPRLVKGFRNTPKLNNA